MTPQSCFGQCISTGTEQKRVHTCVLYKVTVQAANMGAMMQAFVAARGCTWLHVAARGCKCIACIGRVVACDPNNQPGAPTVNRGGVGMHARPRARTFETIRRLAGSSSHPYLGVKCLVSDTACKCIRLLVAAASVLQHIYHITTSKQAGVSGTPVLTTLNSKYDGKACMHACGHHIHQPCATD